MTRMTAGDSETSFVVNLVALVLSIGVTVGCHFLGLTPFALFMVLLASLLVFTVVLETVCFPKTCPLRNWKVLRPLSLKRVLFREAALLVTFGAIALAYWLFPVYSTKEVVRWYFPFLRYFVPFLLVLSVPYFCVMDRIDPEEEDAMCRIGRAILTFRPTVTRFELANYVRSWIVKAFWLALMQPAMIDKIRLFVAYRWHEFADSALGLYAMANTIVYGIDLCYASAGYALNFKLFGTHTRTAEPTLSGWLAAIVCYAPFWGALVVPYYLAKTTGEPWRTLFPEASGMWWTWAAAIVLCELVYSLATVAAGIRFSNLTWRGLWKTGPYRFTKHPAYVFKNLSYWLISVPFLTQSGPMAVKMSLVLLCTNLVYYWRAKTEERHLSRYPEYVAYALEMNDKSIFRWCAKLLPFLRYKQQGGFDEAAALPHNPDGSRSAANRPALDCARGPTV